MVRSRPRKTATRFLATATMILCTLGVVGGRALRSPAASGSGIEGMMPLTGTTEPVARVEVPSSLRGILAEVDVNEGQPVKKGQPLAKLDDALQASQVELARLQAEQTSEIKGAENQIAYAKQSYEALARAGGSPSEVKEKELAYTQSQLALDVQKDRQMQAKVKLHQEQITLERMTLRSPIDGYVLRIHKHAGEQTDDGPVITVVQTSRLNAVFFLPKGMFNKVAIGDRVPLDFDGTVREGTVVAVDPIMEAGLFRAKLEVDNADARIAAGVSASWKWHAK